MESGYEAINQAIFALKNALAITTFNIIHWEDLMGVLPVDQSYQQIKILLTFKRQPHRMVLHTQTIRRQIDDELFECV